MIQTCEKFVISHELKVKGSLEAEQSISKL